MLISYKIFSEDQISKSTGNIMLSTSRFEAVKSKYRSEIWHNESCTVSICQVQWVVELPGVEPGSKQAAVKASTCLVLR